MANTQSAYFNRTVSYLTNLIHNKRKDDGGNQRLNSKLIILESVFATKISELGLLPRTFNVLNNYSSSEFSKINTFEDLMHFAPDDFIKFRGFGKKSMTDLMKVISEKGFEYGEYQGSKSARNDWFHNNNCWKFVGN